MKPIPPIIDFLDIRELFVVGDYSQNHTYNPLVSHARKKVSRGRLGFHELRRSNVMQSR